MLNSAAEQFTQLFFGVEDEALKITRLTGNINSVELIDRMYQLTNVNHAYLMLFMDSYTDAEVEQVLQTVTIR